MPSAAVTYPKLLQTSAETKRKTKFFIFGYAECSHNLSKVTTNECKNAVVTNGGRGVVMMVAIRRPTHRGGDAELWWGLSAAQKRLGCGWGIRAVGFCLFRCDD